MKAMRSTYAIFFIAFTILILSTSSTKAQTVSVVDFEGIPPGTIVSSVYSGYGVSGDAVDGEIGVNGLNPNLGAGVNAAMIFDATCSPGGTPADCSGGDDDLFNPGLGNGLIISEDLDSSDPDDADVVGAVFEFIFLNWGPGTVTVESLDLQDVEVEETEEAKIQLFADGLDDTLIGEIPIPDIGDGNWQTLPINFSGVGSIRIDLQGSGMVDNIRISTEPTAVTLLYFRVDDARKGQVKLSWATSAEIDNVGFNLYRSPTANMGKALKVHTEPAGGGTGGHTYTFTDTPPGNGPWWYWLADIDTKGQETFHHPAFVKVIFNHFSFLPITISRR